MSSMKIRFSLFSIFSLFLFANLNAQLVWTEPAFPSADEPVTVYFNAAEGTGGLAGCGCDVYVHTGVILAGNNGWTNVFTSWGVANDDWKMTPVAGQMDVYSYEIAPSINDRYNVGAGAVVEQMAFVFRNADGSLEGKDVGGTDIFIDVYADNTQFVASITSPGAPSIFTAIGETVQFEGAASASATLELFDNGTLLTTVTGTELSFDIDVTSGGTHLVEFVADNGSEEVTSSFTYVVVGANTVAPLPTGAEPGITDLGGGSARFVLEAPGKDNVFLIGDFNEWQFSAGYQLSVTPSGDFWWIEISGLTAGEFYAFQYMVDGQIRTADPYSNLILDPGNDNWIPSSVFPDMPPYPTGKTTGIVSLFQPDAPDYPWEIVNFDRPDQTNLVVYEMLLRDFLYQDYNGLTSMLDYFEELGINAIELMPVNEFDGNESWGYNPTFHYALDKYYGTPEAFRGFVDECHARGIAVILDVVFNHAHERNPMCLLYWDQANFRPAADNPWFNQEAPHAFSVFFDYNHESPRTKAYVKQVLRHWLEDYKVDGFRFDLSKGFTQNTNGPFDAGAYDATRIATIKDYADEVWSTSDGAYVILEHFTANSEEQELSDYGCMLWGGFGIHNQYLEASMGYSSNLSGVSHKSKGWDDAHLVAYMESHDEERMMYKNLEYGNGSGNYQVKDLQTALERVELCNTFFYSVPGPKMLWQFGELGYDFSINTCSDGVTISDNCRLSNKPIRWDYTEDPDRTEVYNNMRALLHLRNNYEAFKASDFNMAVSQYDKVIHLNHPSMNVTVVGNFNVEAMDVTPTFQGTGTWYEYFTQTTLDVTDVSAPLNLQPGEYRLYTDQPVDLPEAVTSDREVLELGMEWVLSPNPTASAAVVNFTLENTAGVGLRIFDLQGRMAALVQDDILAAGHNQLELPRLKPGMYLVQLEINGASSVQKLVVTE